MAGSKAGRGNVAQAELSNQPPQKKPRTTKAATTRPKKRGKLSFTQLLDLPPEVFSEIAKHLMPVDILSLSRSNKIFREMLMSRTSQALWKATIRNVPNMPECPPGFSEPEYISLLYSKMCSMCGAKALRRMDPYLLARLCRPCHNETTQVVFMHDPLYELVPRSPMTGLEPAFCTTFKSEMRNVQRESSRHKPDSKYYEDRKAEVDKWQKYGKRLEKFLDSLDNEKVAEINGVREKRLQDIKARAIENGWTAKDMKPAPDNRYEWHLLVDQPKPITNRTWANLYPKLLPLLESNHEYHQRVGRLRRKRGRLDMLQDMVSGLREGIPPLVHVRVKSPSQADNPDSSTTSASRASTAGYHDVEIEMPFPSTDELLHWPMIKSIIKADTPPEEARVRLEEIQDDIEQAVVEWREEVERDLIEIWKSGEEDEPEYTSSTSGASRNDTGRNLGMDKATMLNSKPQKVQLDLPDLIVTFGNPDGTTTTSLHDLSPGTQLLLRADTVFKGHGVHHTYPAIVPRAFPSGHIIWNPAEWNCKGRWKAKRFSRDDESSAVAKELLARIGRPNATSAETQAFGARFQCGRCTAGSPETWDSLVQHYAQERRQWKQAQEKMQTTTTSKITYRNTHDLGPGNSKPFARLVAQQPHHSLHSVNPMMKCVQCEEIGIASHYRHVSQSEENAQSTLTGHLKDVHGIVDPVYGVHFKKWRYERRYEANHFDDETDETEDDDEDEGYYDEEELYESDDDESEEGEGEENEFGDLMD